MGTKPLVETETQVYLVVTSAILMGFSFGLVFGILDVEDEKASNIKLAMMREENICYPIGAIFGAIATVVNQQLREDNGDYAFDPLDDDVLDDDF
eukprot:CAMPEP_0175092654 /NCGR_PEP_ID=MMETSP0086_2-20121207/2578_1 /TAXON_ID=136419 /ORGANISM="Unknown Unknown, Strain D1" /LENGTH=94 /DNA_ID=CAMNT_0016365531 /DNA_START=464 /DNA_END=748 /DNA_ORIENTATION=-